MTVGCERSTALTRSSQRMAVSRGFATTARDGMVQARCKTGHNSNSIKSFLITAVIRKDALYGAGSVSVALITSFYGSAACQFDDSKIAPQEPKLVRKQAGDLLVSRGKEELTVRLQDEVS
ncbi:hypothetical protein OKW31_002727 [Paraburkholderia atlantica]